MLFRRRRALLESIRAEWGERGERGVHRATDRVRNMDAIAEYHRSRLESTSDASSSLDDRTWDDLHLDAVFAAIDRTESTLGQQALYHRLRTAPVAEDLDSFEALVSKLTADAPTRERAQMALTRLQDPHGYDLWWLAQPDSPHTQTRAWHAVFPLLTAIIVVALLLVPIWPVALFIPLVTVVLNLNLRIGTVKRIGPLLGPFRQLGPLLATAEDIASIIPSIPSIQPALHTLRRLRTIASWVGRDPMKMGELASSIFEYINLLFLLDLNAMYFAAKELRLHGAALLPVIAATGDVDAAISVASLRASTSTWTRPTFKPAGAAVTLSDIYHPLIETPVPNSIHLSPPNGVLVTGSNMSGKSTFLRTVGVNAVLAQTINTCCARTYEAPVFHVRSVIGRSDDLIAGKSYYITEVESVLALVRASASPEPHLFLFDELFRGTNAIERIAAAESVLTELISTRHIVLTATHDAELVDLLSDTYAPYHFTDTLGPDGLIFDHHLHPGPAHTRNAIALLQLHGAPPTLITRALARATDLDHQRRIATRSATLP